MDEKEQRKIEADRALLYEALKRLDMAGQPLVEECPQCGGYHRIGYTGDCRDDAMRYAGPYGERE